MGVSKSSGCGSSNKTGGSAPSGSNSGTKTGSSSKTSNNPKGSYTVKAGETMSHISKKLGTNVNSLMKSNPQIKDADKIYSGQKINTLNGGVNLAKSNATDAAKTYTVKPGDNLSKIAKNYGTTVGNLLRANPSAINQRDLVYPGQRLNVPAGGTISKEVKGITSTDYSKLNNKLANTPLPRNGVGYTTYQPQSRQYATQQTVQKLQDIAKSWNAKHPNSPIQIGDIGKKGGGLFKPHVSHQKGVDIDMRPFSKNGKQGPVSIYSKNYDAALTREFVRDVKAKFPNAVIGFQDKALLDAGLTRNWGGHHDHLHIRF